jgi:hypothetical protein
MRLERSVIGKTFYKAGLRILIGSVALSALLGIYALLARELDEWSARTLGTTVFISGAAILVMTNMAIIEVRQKFYFYLSIIGLAAALVGLPLFLIALWTENGVEELWKWGASFAIVSIWTAHSSMLSLRRLPQQYHLLMPLAALLGAALGLLIMMMIWTEEVDSGEWRIAGVLAILFASATVIIPVLPRLVELDAPELPAAYAPKTSYCPNCGAGVDVDDDAGRCAGCGASFAVTFGGNGSA